MEPLPCARHQVDADDTSESLRIEIASACPLDVYSPVKEKEFHFKNHAFLHISPFP